MSYRNDQTGLIAALFDAASGADSGWVGFLTLLAAMTQADAAALNGGPGAQETFGTCPPLNAETVRQMRTDRIYAADNLPGPPAGVRLRAVKLRIGRDDYAVLQIRRAAHERDFRSAEALYLDGLVPFLGQAVAIRQAQEVARRRAALSERLAERLGAGWILFDRMGTIIDLSQGLAKEIPGANLRLAERRRLEPPDPEAAQKFRSGFAQCVSGQGPVSIVLSVAPRIELVLAPERVEGPEMVLGLVRAESAVAQRPADDVAAHLGLSRSEARLVAQVCDGESLRSAAARLGWTEETARSTSKQIYSRLGVKGQAGLLRLVLNGALWLR